MIAITLKPQKNNSFLNKIIFSVVNIALYSTVASAGTMGDAALAHDMRPLITVSGGFASVHAGHSQSYLGTDNDRFSYHINRNNNSTGLVGFFLGEEFTQITPLPFLRLQAGLEYNYLWNNHFNGTNTVGIQPNTSTHYTYGYAFETQQLLAVAKVLSTTHQIFHPYLSGGVGAAFNHVGQYNAYTLEAGSVNLSPTFHFKNQSHVSYALGIGVDTTLNQHFRLGFGYRFTDMGKASFGKGKVSLNNYTFPTNFTIMMPHVYANQAVVQLSYLA